MQPRWSLLSFLVVLLLVGVVTLLKKMNFSPPVDFLCQFNFTYCGPAASLLLGTSDPSGSTNKHAYLQGGHRETHVVFLVFPDLVRDPGLPWSGSGTDRKHRL